VTLSRRVDKYSSIDIKLTQEEQDKLWPIQYHAEKIDQQRQAERDAKRKIELEALEWWP
jgi:flagellar capping protein FliD